MSYLIDANGEKLAGAFTSNYNLPITLVAWVKKANAAWDNTADGMVQLSETADEFDDSISIVNPNIDDAVSVFTREAGGAQAQAQFAPAADTYNDTWVIVVGVFTSATDRKVYIENSTNTAANTTSRIITGTLDQILVGNRDTALALHHDGLIAEVCIWDKELSTVNIDALQTASETGPAPNTIENGNVIGYWPLSADNATQSNEGNDAGGDLTVTNATFSADHPTIGDVAVILPGYHGANRGIMRGLARGMG